MTTPMLMTEHLTEETLAAYVDDRLDSATREPVTQHLASCGECREIVLMTTAYQADEDSAKVTRGSFGGSWWAAATGGLAAAAAIAVMAVQPNSLFFKNLYEKVRQASAQTWALTMKAVKPGTDVDDLVEASEGVAVRSSMGRLAGGFPYSKEPSTMRGLGEDEGLEGLGAKAKLLQIRADLESDLDEKKSPDPRRLGLVRLLTAEKGAKDVSAAVTSLEDAYRVARGEEQDFIAIDLAAALIAYANWSGRADANNARAFELSNDVLKGHPKSPEALWNRAVALESLNRDDEALKAWDAYLKVDSAPDSPWAQEAARHKARIESRF